MKILYGVQGTGNGHITRARIMNRELIKAGIDVDYLFSGREPGRYFNMQAFGNYQCFDGLTLHMEGSRINYPKTFSQNNPVQLIRDIHQLELDQYDLVVTDFEPITAWAARRNKMTSIAIGHQYAFQYPVPCKRMSTGSKLVLDYFAPASFSAGLHWHRFAPLILPPVIDPPVSPETTMLHKILVYLPYNSLPELKALFTRFPQYQFYIYGKFATPENYENIHSRPLSRENFIADLNTSNGIISNTGFGLISEAIQYGKKILSLPILGHAEQLSNAVALKQLGIADIISTLDTQALSNWLPKDSPQPVMYPNVAAAIVRWIVSGELDQLEKVADFLWNEIENQPGTRTESNRIQAS